MTDPDSEAPSRAPTSGSDGGERSTVRALATQVKPPFMLPAVGTAVFGALSAPALEAPVAGVLHVVCVSVALYVAHLRDERVDAYLRDEEEPLVPDVPLRVATLLGTGLFGLALVGVWSLTGALAAVLTVPLIALAWLHAPYLDTNPVTVSTDYPTAIAIVVVGGYAVQTGSIATWIVWAAAAIAAFLVGATITLDRLDRVFDEGIDKRTVPVVVGDARAARLSALALCAGGVAVFAGVGVGVLSGTALVAGVVPFVTALASARASPRRAARIQMAGAYPFVGLLFLVLCLSDGCTLTAIL